VIEKGLLGSSQNVCVGVSRGGKGDEQGGGAILGGARVKSRTSGPQ